MTGTLKIGEALQFIEEELKDYDSKIVIFGHHREVLEEIATRLKGSVLVTGETPLAARQARIDAFQKDPECRFFVGSTPRWDWHHLTAASHAISWRPTGLLA